MLKLEIYHLVVKEGIVLGKRISNNGTEVDRTMVENIEKLTTPNFVKGVIILLGHVGFYREFIKDFSRIAHPLCKLLDKDAKFMLDDVYL